MLHRMKVLLAIIAAIFLVLSWGCNRYNNTESLNKAPIVSFVNIPLDSTTFNYAPVVRWYGYDPDGLVDGFQYHDDSTQAAVDAYNNGDAALQAYINSLPSSAWINTFSNADTIYLRRAETDSITQHIFMIRCVDNEGAISPVKVRTYFRTNNPPDAPLVKWALDVSLDSAFDYQPTYHIPDTLYWGDTLTSTYGGIGFLWKGTDPDSRALNIIPLTYQYLLVNTTTGDTVPYAVIDDSNHVVGYRKGWSPWNGETQVTYSAINALAVDSNFVFDGNYQFRLRVRDDGLTEASSEAQAFFYAYSAVNFNDLHPLWHHDFDKQVLLLDWNFIPGARDTTFGYQPDQVVHDFFDGMAHEGLQLAEQYRSYFPSDQYPYEIRDEVDGCADKNFSVTRQFFYPTLRQYKWVWIICDNPSWRSADLGSRIKVLQDYMKVGGQVMITGRRPMNLIGAPVGENQILNPTFVPQRFLRDYFNLSTVSIPGRYTAGAAADFAGTTTTDRLLANLEVDTALVHTLNFANRHLYYLPEIEYFGRAGATNGTDYTVSMYNYYSNTANDSGYAHNVDCEVISSTSSRAYLRPAPGHTRILAVTRIHNVTRNCDGELISWDREVLPSGIGGWRIVVSTPAQYGAWQTSDSLQVDYQYIPILPSHDQPVAADYIRFQNLASYNRFTGEFSIELWTRFRSSIFTFPFSLMKNDFVPGLNGHKIGVVVAYQALFFNQPKIYRTNFGTGGRPNP